MKHTTKKVLTIILVIAVVVSVLKAYEVIFLDSAVPKAIIVRYVKKNASALEDLPYAEYAQEQGDRVLGSDEATGFIERHIGSSPRAFRIDAIMMEDASGKPVSEFDDIEFIVFHCRKPFLTITSEYTRFYYSKSGAPYTYDQGNLTETSPGVFECNDNGHVVRQEKITGNWYYHYEAWN